MGTIIQMAEGKPPLSHLHPLRALLAIPSAPAPTLESSVNDWSDSLHSFLRQCLVKNPNDRPTAAELLKHFIKNAGKRTVIQQFVVNAMPQIEKYRNEKRKEAKEQQSKKKKKAKKKKKKKRIIFNAEPVSDDACISP